MIRRISQSKEAEPGMIRQTLDDLSVFRDCPEIRMDVARIFAWRALAIIGGLIVSPIVVPMLLIHFFATWIHRSQVLLDPAGVLFLFATGRALQRATEAIQVAHDKMSPDQIRARQADRRSART